MQIVDFTGLMMQVCHQFDSSLLASGDLVFADLLQVVETTCIKLVDKKSWQSTCIKPLDNLQQSVQVIRTHPDIGLIILTSKKPASEFRLPQLARLWLCRSTVFQNVAVVNRQASFSLWDAANLLTYNKMSVLFSLMHFFKQVCEKMNLSWKNGTCLSATCVVIEDARQVALEIAICGQNLSFYRRCYLLPAKLKFL